jgi:hypothetical protein
MDTRISPPLACRYCHHYQIQGRRGGHCNKLGAPVKGKWAACSLMAISFSSLPVKQTYGVQLHAEQYVSEIYSYEAAARIKSSSGLQRAMQAEEAKVS